MIRRPPRSTQSRSSAASDVYKRQVFFDAVCSDAGAIEPVVEERAVLQLVQRLGRAEDGQVGERLDDDDHHVGAAEQADLRQCFRAEALAVEGPDRDPADHAALVGG
eukprot:TRINITY_DN10251_c0_g1_i1.p3 TRINITY_DN10251_c0_g1~~TRINITY_DN10251_c0_g1_i1.p3  ORF type:complete len:107 (+),score=43.28 TRINITY_DN10251_c0_g1_i1:93-413(+)